MLFDGGRNEQRPRGIVNDAGQLDIADHNAGHINRNDLVLADAHSRTLGNRFALSRLVRQRLTNGPGVQGSIAKIGQIALQARPASSPVGKPSSWLILLHASFSDASAAVDCFPNRAPM